MKKRSVGMRLLSLLLTLALCMTALPLQVLAEEVPETGPAAPEEAPEDSDETGLYGLEPLEPGEAAPLTARTYSDNDIVKRVSAQIDAMTAPYTGYSSISDLNSKVGKGSLSQFDYSGSQCVTYVILRLREKLFGKNISLGPTIADGKSAANNFISYGYGVNGSHSGKRFTAINGQEFGVAAYTNDGGRNITSNSWVCFNSSSNHTNSSYGHIVFVEEVAEVNGIRYVYYTEGGAGFKSWPVRRQTFDEFYDNGRGYTGTIVFFPSGGIPSPPHTDHVKGSYLWPEALHPHYNYFTCSVCGAAFTDGTTTWLESCSQCQATGTTSAPTVQVSEQRVTLSWTYSGGASSFDAYLVQEPYHWEDIKYHISTTSAACTFSGVAPGEYCAFVIARPNPDTAQSDWTSLSVSPPHAHTWNSGYVSREPTFTSYGERTYACVDCGETRAESIPMLDSVTAQYSGNIRVTYHRSGLLEIKGTGEFSVLGYSCIDFSQSGFRMLNYLNQVTSVRIGEGITSVMGCVFGGMMNLESIDFPSSLTYIQDNLFDYDVGYLKLKSVYIPANVTQMADRWSSEDSPFTGNPFFHCKGLTAIEVSPLNPCFASQDGVLFYKDMRTLLAFPGGRAGAYTVPSGVDLIVDSAFSNCEGLTHASLPAGIREIGAYAFSHCAGLESISIPENVTAISYSAFAGCAKLASVSIPKNVKKIGTYAFENCPGLKDIYYGGTAAQWAAIAIRDGNEPLQNAVVHYAADSSGNTMGPNNELAWSQSGRTITVTGPVSAAEPLWAAAYDQNGRLLSVSPVTASGGSVSFPGGAASVRLIWTDPGRAPKCASVFVPLK